jgi:hypothetical protein
LRLAGATMIALLVVLGGCTPERNVDVVTLLSHAHCHQLAAGVRKVDMNEVAQLRGSVMLGFDDASGGTQEDLLLIAISAGQRPTAGYSLELSGPAEFSDGDLLLQVVERRPPSDAMVAHVVTHPCLVVGIPERNVQRIRVLDDRGELIGEVSP